MTTRTLVAKVIGGYWHVKTNDPDTIKLFGTDTLPMPYGARVPVSKVRETLEARNPGALVVVQS